MTIRRAFALILCAISIFSFVIFGQTNNKNEATKQLYALFDSEWENGLRDNPTFASYLGDKRYNDKWRDNSLAAFERRNDENKTALERLNKIDRSQLSAADQLNYDLFKKDYEQSIESYGFKQFLAPVSQQGGIQTQDDLANFLNLQTVKDYENWLARLNALPVLMDQTLELMQAGKKENVLLPKIIMQRVPAQIDKQITATAEESPFYSAFKEFPKDISEAEQIRLRNLAKDAINKNVIPSYRKLKVYFEKEYLPASYEKAGVWQRKNGDKLYEFLARSYTTTSMTPQEIHEKGLSEVKRIRAEMEKIKTEVGFKGDMNAFFDYLRTDPKFFYKTPDELLNAYRANAKRIDPELVKIFRTLPRTPYGVIPIPDNIAPDTTTAYYNSPAADGSRPGYYYVNLYKPEVRPKWEMMALSLHESVPGHHLQIALAQELGDIPNFRKFGGYTAFVEGWGLYAESLGEDMNLYSDPYDKFGQLTYEMWRAVRLVVDTGMHYYKWDRQRAIDYFKANAAKTDQDIINEIDRYISDPGQALAYKIGELKIKELRAKSKKELGDKFDIKEFHDIVLLSGAVPLDILERNVDEYIAKKSRKSSAMVRTFQLTPFGYIKLPNDYYAYMDTDYMDAWSGVIEPFDESFKIRFSDGLIVSVFDGEDKKIQKKSLDTENGTIVYAVSEKEKTKRILAKIKSANFSATIENDSDIEKFLEIIKNYRSGRCESCFNSRNTKNIKKYLERQKN